MWRGQFFVDGEPPVIRGLNWLLDRLEEVLIGTLMALATLIIFVAVCAFQRSWTPVSV